MEVVSNLYDTRRVKEVGSVLSGGRRPHAEVGSVLSDGLRPYGDGFSPL